LNGNSPSHSKLRNILQQWRLHFCEKPPKGFEKYFKPGNASKNASKEAHKEAPKEAPKDAAPNELPKGPPKSGPFSSGPFGSGPQSGKPFSMKYEFKFGSSGGK
jgi:AFG3 family protein